MKIVKCSCRACRYGLHNSARVKTRVRNDVKGARSRAKADLAKGKEDIATKVYIGYTD